MFTNPSPLVAPYSYESNQNNRQWTPQSPQEVELMMRQKFQQPVGQNQPLQTDPYIELQNELANCSLSVRNKIIKDKEYLEFETECDLMIKQMIEGVFIPQILNTPNGRIFMEKFCGTVKQLKSKYSQEEAQTNERLQTLLNDKVVQERMKQLSNTNIQNPTYSENNKNYKESNKR